ncbi:hypothetical protein CLCR_04905 [Cladophialophora carrionii]|uniref:Ring-like domain-containing protein n=1 Tax=Cladophialophora carrionii TaxID=86049 RepID=A0A1C1CKR3_9EURO|nr:hypothetical protein CLCR_04905 [Cladophialophora carrionii]
MAMGYINYIKAKAHLATARKSEAPVLSEEDEKFLDHITSQENPPPLPARPDVPTVVKDAQLALMDGAQNVPLPPGTPSELAEEPDMVQDDDQQLAAEPTGSRSRKAWSWLRRDSRDAKRQLNEATAAGLDDIAADLKKRETEDTDEEKQAKKEEEDMTIMLERLNLAAVNNRVFSISDETQELLQKFNLVFKDLINGVPTAYDDLEKLLTNSDRQLQSTFNSLPGFLQKLIERLPETMTKGFAPEIMAAAAERAQKSGVNMENAGKAAAAAKKMGFKTPSLKELVGKPTAITATLRSIMNYLRARFPAFMGVNVLWSLAMFVLLFVFWYCHKRGREVRLEKERQLTEEEMQKLDVEYRAEHPDAHPTTTADKGASIEDVKAGIQEVEAAKQATEVPEQPVQVEPKPIPPTTVP